MAAPSFTKAGTKTATPVKLDKDIFGIEVKNHELLKQAYDAYLANNRQNLAVTKTRGLIRGGGRKPWRQKGTGRARFGSSRNPIWRGGGIVFGPTGNENYSHKITTQSRRQALRQALSLANDDGKVKVVEAFASMNGKTKDMAKFLSKVEATGKVICVVEARSTDNEKAARNIPNLRVMAANQLNVYDVLNADQLLISRPAIDVISNWLGSASTKPAPKEKA